MPGERQRIDAPLTFDLSQFLVNPALFVMQQSRDPHGIVERSPEGITIAHTPWYSEFNVQLEGIEGVAILYLMPYTDENNVFFACIDQTFEGFFTYLSGADYGDELTKLVALQWPELHAMLLHSNRRTVGQMMLFNTIMGGRVQWAVGCTLPTAQETFPNDIAVNIITSALKVHIGTSNVVALSESLPGLVGVLGGSKLGMRRLNTTGGLLSSTASLATGIADTLQGKPDVGGIFQSSRDIFKQVVNLWEDR